MLKEIKSEMESRGYVCEIIDVSKNGVVTTGLRFGKAEDNVHPTAYKHEKWDGMSVSEIATELECLYNERPEIDASALSSPEFIKAHAKLCLQRETSEDILKRPFLDLELYVRVVITEEMSFKVPSTGIDGLTADEIFDYAIENTKGTMAIKGMSAIVSEMMGISAEDILASTGGKELQYVVVNDSRLHGAVAMYYKGMLKEFCRDLHIDGCYILPSSIHEIILIPNDGYVDESSLTEMVREVNSQTVDPKEQLADHHYYYDLNENAISY